MDSGRRHMGAGGRDGRSVRVKQAPRRLRLGVLALSKAACGGSRRTTVLTDYLLSAREVLGSLALSKANN